MVGDFFLPRFVGSFPDFRALHRAANETPPNFRLVFTSDGVGVVVGVVRELMT